MDRRSLLRGALFTGALGAPPGYFGISNRLAHHHFRLDRPALGRRLTIGILTDIHAPCYPFDLTDLHRLVQRSHCDLLLILGDTVDAPGNEKLIGGLFEPLEAPLGMFAILGNHEHWHDVDIEAVETHYRNVGVRLLVNEVVDVDGLRLVGLDDLVGGKPKFHLCEGAGPTVVMSHCPASIDAIGRHVSDALVLSGHTHGGQIAPFGRPIHTPGGSGPYIRGRYEVGENTLLVSQGLGCVGLPFRIGVRPAFVTVELG